MRWALDWLVRLWCLSSSESRRRTIGYILVAMLVVGSVGGTVFLTYSWLSRSVFFQITDIKVAGCDRVNQDTVLTLAGVDVRSNILALDLDRVSKQITANPWIEKARVKRDWPSRLEIIVKERQPIAFLNTSGGLRYVDKHGVVFTAVGQDDDLDFPTITGLENVDLSDKKTPLFAGLAAILKFIDYAGHGSPFLLSQNISEMHLSKDGSFILFLADNPFPIYLGLDISRAKYFRLAKVLRWLYKKRKFENVAYIRLDYGEKKVLVGKKDATSG